MTKRFWCMIARVVGQERLISWRIRLGEWLLYRVLGRIKVAINKLERPLERMAFNWENWLWCDEDDND